VNQTKSLSVSIRSGGRPFQLQIWHVFVLTALVAIAVVNIQDQRRTEPTLIAVAIAGFVLYTLIGWGTWNLARRFQSRLGTIPIMSLYAAAMSGLFMIATITYLVVEHAYLVGF
jgi:predicted lysophospholipase L1 biosynthesis ABC-type transport system permease subunit